jgi:hypothetical protein
MLFMQAIAAICAARPICLLNVARGPFFDNLMTFISALFLEVVADRLVSMGSVDITVIALYFMMVLGIGFLPRALRRKSRRLLSGGQCRRHLRQISSFTLIRSRCQTSLSELSGTRSCPT